MTSPATQSISRAGAQLQKWLAGNHRLPIQPTVFLKLMELGKKSDASPNDYAKVINTSQSLASKILSAVNSSWYGVRYEVKDTARAVNLLGIVSVRLLAITQCVAAVHDNIQLDAEILEKYWEAGMVKAQAALYMAERLNSPSSDEAFVAGLMQDMAMPVMHQFCPELYDQFMGESIEVSELCDREREIFGMDHGEVAAKLASGLGIPDLLCDLLLMHHQDPSAMKSHASTPALAEAVRFAGLFPHILSGWEESQAAQTRSMIEQSLGDSENSTCEILAEIQRRYTELAGYVRPGKSKKMDLAQLLREATGEVADTTESMVGQIQSLMSNATQVDSKLAAVSVEAMRLQEQTEQDALTGVLNRHGLEMQGPQELKRIREAGLGLMLLFGDLDGFKHLNDRFGHATGDTALQHAASILRATFGPTALVSRYGGDEFVVLLGGLAGCAQAKSLALECIGTLKQGLTDVSGRTIELYMSIGGIWEHDSTSKSDLHDLLTTADQLMYQSKASGESTVVFSELAPRPGCVLGESNG